MTTKPRTYEYPVLPLKNVVVFPKTVVTLIVGREKSIAAVEDAASQDRRLLVVTQREVELEDPKPQELYPVGTLAEIVQIHRQPDGNVQIVVEGVRRVALTKFLPNRDFLRAQSAEIVEVSEPGPRTEALIRHTLDLFDRYVKLNRNMPSDAYETVSKVEDAGRMADLITAHLPIDLGTKQQILETIDHWERLDKIGVALSNEIEIQEVEHKIRARIRQQMDKNQREYYLKEQLKAIHEELGNDIQSEAADFRERISSKGLPEAAATKLQREVERLERMPATSPEGNVIRTYLDLVLSLPWNERTEDRLDIDYSQTVLDEDHYGLERIKERIIEFLAVRQLVARQHKPDEPFGRRGPILCLIGPPGVGKTSLGRSIARAMGRKFVRISLGGVRDEAEIRGHRRTYVGAMPGRIIQAMRTAGTKNPVMLLDEIDKLASDFRGDPASALLEVLDPEQNVNFSDHYVDMPYDLSEVMFIATANVRWNIPRPLLDRMEVIELHGYTEEEKLEIAKRYLLPKQLEEHGLTPDQAEISDRVLRKVIREYTREAGVRNLERSIAGVCRKSATWVLKHEGKMRVTPQRLEEFLGPPKFREKARMEENQVGVVMGLAWTEHGGEILPVEVATMPGKGGLLITGRLGEVMQESARAALSYARSRAEALQIDRSFQEKLDLHIHLPEGAIPKDGPSAGVTMATALISALTKRPVRSDLAMTGEITLLGRVLPVGGIKEKMLAAHRVGIKRILLPKDNVNDLVEIPKKIRSQMEFIAVDSMDQVLREVFTTPLGGEWVPGGLNPTEPAVSDPPPDDVSPSDVIETSNA